MPADDGELEVIRARGLRLMGKHGALPEEALRSQPFELDIDLWAELGAACRDDDLSQTVDYAEICEAARQVVEGEHLELLEALAHRVALAVLQVASPWGRAAEVSVRKLRPPVPFDLVSAGVTVRRRWAPT